MSLAELRYLEGEQEPIALFPGPLVIGRDSSCDRVIAHEKVSKRHVEIWRDGEHRWYVRDLGSSNGTLVDRKRISGPTELTSGATLHVGAVGFSFLTAREPVDRVKPVRMAPRSARTRGPANQAGEAGDESERSDDTRVATRVRTPLPRRNELARLAWGLVVVMICIYAGLQAWRFYGPNSASTLEERAATPSGDASHAGSPGALGREGEQTAVTPAPGAADSNSLVARDAGGTSSDDVASDVDAIAEPDLASDTSEFARRSTAIRSTDMDFRSATRADDDPDPRATPAGEASTGPAGSQGHAEPERLAEPPADTPDVVHRETPPAPEPPKERTPAIDPVLDALDRNDFGELARHLLKTPDSIHRPRIVALLGSAPIVSLARNGLLGEAGEAQLEPILARAYPRRCTPEDALALAQLPFATAVVRRELRTRFEHDYQTGLGRKVGKWRLGPHPKQVGIELKSIDDGKESGKVLCGVEGKTPWIAPEDVPEEGLTDDEIWQMTVAPLLAKLTEALLEDSRKVSP